MKTQENYPTADNVVHSTVTQEDFGILDGYGRDIGARVTVRSFVQGGEGTLWGVQVQATRNGWNYGATQSTEIFPSEVEAHAHAEKKVAAAKKRAVAKFCA